MPSASDLTVDSKTLYRMMYLYVAIMQGWQIRKLPQTYTDGKPHFEMLRGHLPDPERPVQDASL